MDELEFAKVIQLVGGTAYRVGGSIRNQILQIPAKDNDYCITGLTEQQFLAAFPFAQQVGNAFPVFLLEIDGESCEVAFARTEKKTGAGHTAFEVFSSPDVSIRDDLSRRDFTMNAMAYDILAETLIDPFNGRHDIATRVIRATGEAFKEDPLRVYRAARFAAQLGFSVSHSTIVMCRDEALQEEMRTLSPERVFAELEKAMLGKHPTFFFYYLGRSKARAAHIHFKEIDDLVGVEQNPEFHPEGDAYAHTMGVLDEMSKLTDQAERRFAALTHDLGKALTPKELWPKHHGHEEAGLAPLHSLCNRIKAPNRWRQAAHFGTENHMRFHRVDQMRDVKKVDLIEAARKSVLGIEGFAQLGLADTLGRDGLYEDHPNYIPFLHWANLIATVKGKKELEGLKAWDDKRKRQAALIKQDNQIRKEVTTS